MNFKGKVALITGAAVGIGRAAALKFAEGGADLLLIDLSEEKLAVVKEEVAPFNVKVECFTADVSDEAAIVAAIKEGESRLGPVDILVNNAALWRCHSDFVDTPVEEWKRFLDVNIMSVVYVTKAVLPGMLERNWGRIINIASVAGVYGNAKMAHYSATKGALIAMTRALAKEVADKGVTVNSVSPGSVSPSDIPDPNHVQPSQLSFAGRTGSNMENAELICFLASEGAGYICGQNIQIDGCRKKQ